MITKHLGILQLFPNTQAKCPCDLTRHSSVTRIGLASSSETSAPYLLPSKVSQQPHTFGPHFMMSTIWQALCWLLNKYLEESDISPGIYLEFKPKATCPTCRMRWREYYGND